MAKPGVVIKVGESEFKPLLDRVKIRADIKNNLIPWTNLIEDLVNYGSNLIPRCFSSSNHELKDTGVLAILLRQVVAT